MPSEMKVADRPNRGVERRRAHLVGMLADVLEPGESVVAVLPFTTVPKRPKGPEGKIRTGVQQSWRRYRPLVATDRRLFVFETGRTPNPREVLEVFRLPDVRYVETTELRRFGQQDLVVELPGVGVVHFETGRHERRDLDVVVQLLSTDRRSAGP